MLIEWAARALERLLTTAIQREPLQMHDVMLTLESCNEIEAMDVPRT